MQTATASCTFILLDNIATAMVVTATIIFSKGQTVAKSPDKISIEQFLWLLGYSNNVEAILNKAIRAACGLSLPAKDLLGQVKMSGGRLKMRELSERLSFSPGGMTRLVDRLIRDNLLKRATEKTDRRVVYVEITAAGSRLLSQAQPIMHDIIARTFADHLDSADVKNLKAVMTKLLKGNGVWDGVPKLTSTTPH